MDWTYFLGVAAVAVCAVPVLNVIRFSSIKLLAGDLTPIEASDVPEAQIDILISAEKFIYGLGFERRLHVKRSAVIQGQPWGLYGAVYYHSVNNTWALVYREPGKHPVFSWKLIFITPTDRANLATECRSEIEANLAGFELNSPLLYDPAKLWQSHQDFISAHSGCSPIDISEHDILRAFEALFFGGLIAAGKVKYKEGFYVLPLSVSFFYWKRLNSNLKGLLAQKKDYENQPSSPLLDSHSAGSDYSAYQSFKSVQESNQFGWIAKTGFLLFSVILFGISFGLINFSIQSLMILVCVLFVHEMGHLLGMWLFGYRDLRMLFIPFMGALASGRKEKVSALQEAIILLLGPLPGYCIGIWILFSSAGDMSKWVAGYGMTSVILNALNLLPFMPLDGGRIVNLALFNRLPYLQFGFAALSVIAFGCLGIFLHENVWLVLAVALFFGLPRLKAEILLLQHLLKAKFHKSPFSLEKLLSEIHEQRAWRELAVQKKWPLLDSISYRIQHANTGFTTSALIFSLWAAAIIVPLGVALPPEAVDTFKMLAFDDHAGPSLEALRERYADASDDNERIHRAILIVGVAKRKDPNISREYWGKVKNLVNGGTLSEKDRAKYFARIAGMCAHFDGEKCEKGYLHAAIDLYISMGNSDAEIVPLWIQLADGSEDSDEQTLEYLEKADRLIPGINDKNTYFWKYDINCRKAEILSRQGKNDVAERLLLDLIDVAPEKQGDMLPYVQAKLLGLYVLSEKQSIAIERYQDWISRGNVGEKGQMSLSVNIHYMMAMMLADSDPERARQFIQRVVARGPVEKIEVEIAKQMVGGSVSAGGGNPAVKILAMAKEVAEPYEWLSLANSLGEGAEIKQSKRLDAVLRARWYSKMRNFLEQPDYRELLQLIHRSYEITMDPATYEKRTNGR